MNAQSFELTYQERNNSGQLFCYLDHKNLSFENGHAQLQQKGKNFKTNVPIRTLYSTYTIRGERCNHHQMFRI